MMESPPVPKSERKLSTEERIELNKKLNGLPLSQLLELEFALDIPDGIMPAPSEAIGIRNHALFQWVEGSSGVGWDRFLKILKVVTGVTLASRAKRLELVIEGNISEVDAGLLLRMLEEFQAKADAPSLKISNIRSGSIKVILQGVPEELERLETLVNSGELTEILGQQVTSAESFLDLRRVDLRGADLRGVNLRGADLRWAVLCRANLEAANLSKAVLYNADLRRVVLSEANLSESVLYSANFSEANLREANLSSANLSGTVFYSADLTRANLRWTNISGANFIKTDLSEANLEIANLENADLRSAILYKANLEGADLRWANLEQAEFGDNPGLSDIERDNLIARGAIFQDSPGSDVPILV